MNRIGASSSHKRGHSADFANALLQNLSILRLSIRQQSVSIHRTVLLALVGIDTRYFEQTVHTKGASLVRHDGNHIATYFRHSQQRCEQSNHDHGRRDFSLTAASEELCQGLQRGNFQRWTVHQPIGNPATLLLATLAQVFDLWGILWRAIKLRSGGLFFGKRYV